MGHAKIGGLTPCLLWVEVHGHGSWSVCSTNWSGCLKTNKAGTGPKTFFYQNVTSQTPTPGIPVGVDTPPTGVASPIAPVRLCTTLGRLASGNSCWSVLANRCCDATHWRGLQKQPARSAVSPCLGPGDTTQRRGNAGDGCGNTTSKPASQMQTSESASSAVHRPTGVAMPPTGLAPHEKEIQCSPTVPPPAGPGSTWALLGSRGLILLLKESTHPKGPNSQLGTAPPFSLHL